MTPEQKKSLEEMFRQPTEEELAEFDAIVAGMTGTPTKAAIKRLEQYLERDDVPQMLLIQAGELVEIGYELDQ